MFERQSGIQAELKTTRQLVVRFSHAPCVKLTLRTRPDAATAPQGVRVLRLQRDSVPFRPAVG